MVRDAFAAAQACMAGRPTDPEATLGALARAGAELEAMADSMRITGRNIYPATLRDSGLTAALEELIVDLPRTVRWSGYLDGQLDWEIECGVYCVASAALRILGGQPSERELLVTLERAHGRVAVQIIDPAPAVIVDTVRAELKVEVERLAALGGRLELAGVGADDGRRAGPLTLNAWLPDRLEPAVRDVLHRICGRRERRRVSDNPPADSVARSRSPGLGCLRYGADDLSRAVGRGPDAGRARGAQEQAPMGRDRAGDSRTVQRVGRGPAQAGRPAQVGPPTPPRLRL